MKLGFLNNPQPDPTLMAFTGVTDAYWPPPPEPTTGLEHAVFQL